MNVQNNFLNEQSLLSFFYQINFMPELGDPFTFFFAKKVTYLVEALGVKTRNLYVDFFWKKLRCHTQMFQVVFQGLEIHQAVLM